MHRGLLAQDPHFVPGALGRPVPAQLAAAAGSATPAQPVLLLHGAADPLAPAAAVRPAAAKPTDHDVAIRIEGLAPDGSLAVGGAPSTFTVTWTNTSGHRLDSVAPVVSTESFAGARCQVPAGQAQGVLRREDGGVWKELPLSQGTGMDFATTGADAAFALAPGASHTLTYTVQFGADNGPAPVTVDADAFVGGTGEFTRIGRTSRRVTLVDGHRPTASMPTMTPRPTKVTAGGPAVEVEDSPGNFTQQPFQHLAPLLTLADPSGRLRAADVTVEVADAGGWRELPVVEECGTISADTSSLARPLESGPYGRVLNFDFRFALAAGTAPEVTSLTVSAGALADGHFAETVGTRVAVERQG
ncbi:hypothetical protein GCM10009665_74990 [Kitasatospora nipponensis]|uniref:DUF11 domain-containing protein n=1 Tax=Kitasatospora nipponensis TaxID=258049 RepID=A0ABP4DQJ7_9ACTN